MHWKKWLLAATIVSVCAFAPQRAQALEPVGLKHSLLSKAVLNGGIRGGFGFRSRGFGFSFRLGRGLKSHGFLHGRRGVFLVHPRQWGVFDGRRFFSVKRRLFGHDWGRRHGMAVHRGAAYGSGAVGPQTRAQVWSNEDLGAPGWEEDLGPSGWREDLGIY